MVTQKKKKKILNIKLAALCNATSEHTVAFKITTRDVCDPIYRVCHSQLITIETDFFFSYLNGGKREKHFYFQVLCDANVTARPVSSSKKKKEKKISIGIIANDF